MVKNIAVVCNPTFENARALRIADEIAVQLKRSNVAYALFTSYWPQVWDNFTEAWIVGGDGTVNYFINQYPEFHLPLSVFPGGTGNDLHWMIYEEMKTSEQVEKCLSSAPSPIDAGICNGRLFLNGVGIGFDGAIVKDLLGKKKMAGKGSYLLSILKNILRFDETECSFEFNGKKISQETFMISVANGKRYGGGFCIAPKANVNDGLLDLNIISKIPALKRIRYLPVMEKGEHLDMPFNQHHQVDSVVISTMKEWPAHIDGEFMSSKNFEISVLPKKFLFVQ